MKIALILASCLVLVGCGDPSTVEYKLDGSVYHTSLDFQGCKSFTKITGPREYTGEVRLGVFCTDYTLRNSPVSSYTKTWRGVEWHLGESTYYQSNGYYGMINKFIPE